MDNALRPRHGRLSRRWLLIAQLGTALLVGLSANLFAHGGGLDQRGCHNDGSTGEYHCHQGPLAGQSFPSEQAAMDQGLGLSSSPRDSSGTAGRMDYDRDLYDHWVDADGDCQDTRQEVLIAQGEAIRLDAEGCRVVSGVWQGPYTGQRFTDPSDLHVDHIVPLAEAHESGAASWSAQRRRAFANDRDNLLAVEAGENMSKGADDPAEWLPPTGQCAYINQWLTVKVDYGLTADRAEQQALQRIADRCP